MRPRLHFGLAGLAVALLALGFVARDGLAREVVVATQSPTVVRSAFVVVPSRGVGVNNAVCAPGEHALGGGADFHWHDPGDLVISSRPAQDNGNVPADGTQARAWRARGYNGGASQKKLIVYVVCAR